MRSRPALLSILFLSSITSLVHAQYGDRRDTVRYREITNGDVRITTPQGAMTMRSTHDATIAAVRRGGDTVHAWYESLALSLDSPNGEVRPSTDSVIGVPFVLSFDRGRARAMQTPAIPESIKGITDLSQQFHDFFLRLPSSSLTMGVTWTDTLVLVDTVEGRSRDSRQVSTYKVERDTIVGGIRALVISLNQTLAMRSEGPMQGQPLRSELRLEGTETGVFVFSPAENRLLARRREGRSSGPMVLRGAMGQMTLTQDYTYTSSIDAVQR